jgi:hypothetical protein
MAKKELKAKDEERELEIQRDHVLANALGSRAKPISQGVKYAAEELRRYERVLRIAKGSDETNAQASKTPPPPTPEALNQGRERSIRLVELAKEDAELEEIIRNAQNERNEGKDGNGKIVKKVSRFGSSGERSRGLVRRKSAKHKRNLRGMH